mgnify:FL=1
MSDNKIISFEEFRKRKQGSHYVPDSLSDIFSLDLKEQKDLLQWYSFHNHFSPYKLFLLNLFNSNQKEGNVNPIAGFINIFSPSELDEKVLEIISAIEWLERNFIFIDFSNKTFRKAINEKFNSSHATEHEAYQAIENELLHSNKVIIISQLSRCKTNTDKTGTALSFFKTIDDAHLKGISSNSDLIFVDYPTFLQKSWNRIGLYLEVLTK